MAFYYQLQYVSSLARHRHLLWTADQYANREVSIPDVQKSLILNIPISSVDQTLAPLHNGRFYPAHILKTPVPPPGALFRVLHIGCSEFTADFNHPLAGKETVLEKGVIQIDHTPVGEPVTLLAWAGLDAPLDTGDTDYAVPYAFDRPDSSDDALFYENPRKVIHVDRTCSSRITALYGDLIRPDDTVLDLMSGWRSHLPSMPGRVTGLGMNALEMGDNPQLHTHVVHDLNRDPRLPFNDGSFRAVVNTVSIEYLTQPHAVFSEVRRVLKPGGLVIVTFSNRCFPPKTTLLWSRLHPAERLGWVLQVLKAAGFSGLHSRVERGLRRPRNDRYAGQVEEMDPLCAVWGNARLL